MTREQILAMKTCPSCNGRGFPIEHPNDDYPLARLNDCHQCHGSGVVCGKCGKPEGECGGDNER